MKVSLGMDMVMLLWGMRFAQLGINAEMQCCLLWMPRFGIMNLDN
jgi:hypothetical protein